MNEPPNLPPLALRLVTAHGAQPIHGGTLDGFVAGGGDRVLFFCGDPVRFPEALDVAVVLPELQVAFPGRFQVGAVERHDEEAMARRFGVQRWPALVFLRDGAYVTCVAGMHDWTAYLEQVAAALAMPVSRAPTIGIPLVSAGVGGCH
jgi:hydrogenase-1 operon protein HyaE